MSHRGNKSYYTYCIVPHCTSTSFRTPEKLFFRLPYDPSIRLKWFRAMRRDIVKNKISDKSSAHCCEDHFNVEEDTKNFLKHKLMGCSLSLKKGVLPHRFECQGKIITPVRETGQRSRKIRILEEVNQFFSGDPQTSTSTAAINEPVVAEDNNKLNSGQRNLGVQIVRRKNPGMKKSMAIQTTFEVSVVKHEPTTFTTEQCADETSISIDIKKELEEDQIKEYFPSFDIDIDEQDIKRECIKSECENVEQVIKDTRRRCDSVTLQQLKQTKLKVIHIVQKPPNKCTNHFKNEKKPLKHITIQTKDKSYQCDVCETGFKITGGSLHLKKNVLPHIFECQKEEETPLNEIIKKKPKQTVFEVPVIEHVASTSSSDVTPMSIHIKKEPIQDIDNEESLIDERNIKDDSTRNDCNSLTLQQQEIPIQIQRIPNDVVQSVEENIASKNTSSSYKYCMVPLCENTSIKVPNKLFIKFPSTADVQRRWRQAMRRNKYEKKPLPVNSVEYVCEDHFNLKEDMVSYMQFKMMGGKVRIKTNVVPHIFECQKDGIEDNSPLNELDVSLEHLTQEELDVVHSTERPFKCDICNKTYKTKGCMLQHFRIIHAEEKPYKCNECDMGFMFKSCLLKHNKIHTGDKRYKCDVCDEVFKHASYLKTHKRIHTGEKPFECDVCNKRFIQRSNLITHKGQHTVQKPLDYNIGVMTSKTIPNGKKRRFKCDVCTNSFPYKSGLLRHSRIHTGEKPYKCEICDRGFQSRTHLSDHVRIHSSEKPFECDICKTSFKRKSSLNSHIRVHSVDKLYECSICRKSFNWKASFITHFKSHTDDILHEGEIVWL